MLSIQPFTLMLCLLTMSACWCGDYSLSPNGDDAGRGTRESPWRSIAKANAAARPGDTIVFLPGTYPGTIKPARAGEPAARFMHKQR